MALSGIIETGYSFSNNAYPSNYRYKIEWSATQNLNANTSRITVNAYARSINTSTSTSGTIHANVQNYAVPAFFGTISSNWAHLGSNAVTVSHNQNGALTTSLFSNFNINSGASILLSGSISGNVTLDQIPRNATFVNANDFTDETNPSFTFSNPGNFAVNAILKTAGATIVTRNNITNTGNYTFQLTQNEVNTFLSYIPHLQNLTIEYVLQTNVNGTLHSVNTFRSMKVVNANPEFYESYVEFDDRDGDTNNVTGNNQVLIKNCSIPRVSLNQKGIAKKYATLGSNSYKTTVNQISRYSNHSDVFPVSNAFELGASTGAIIDVIDSRNYSTQIVKTFPKILDYDFPVIENFTTKRVNPDFTGTSVNLKVKGKLHLFNPGDVVQNNRIFGIQWRIFNEQTQTWGVWLTNTTQSNITYLQNGNFEVDYTLTNFWQTTSYIIEFKVDDFLRKHSNTLASKVNTIDSTLSFDLNKKTIAVSGIVPQNANNNEIYGLINGIQEPLISRIESKLIVEKGSNTNGKFWKYSDGTMICTKQITGSINLVHWSGGYFGSVALGIPAVNFVGTFDVQVSGNASSGSAWATHSTNSASTPTNANLGACYYYSFADGTISTRTTVVCLGFWK